MMARVFSPMGRIQASSVRCSSSGMYGGRFYAAPSCVLSSPGILRGPQPSPSSTSRRFLRMPPILMGRRSAKIATRKGAADAKKAALYGKYGKLIVTLAKEGGPSPNANTQLRDIIAQATRAGVPKDIIERNIKRASDSKQADYSETSYEAYGPGGVGFIIEGLTDNLNRSAADVRSAVTKGGGKMATAGAVAFNFKNVGQLMTAPGEEVSEDDLFDVAIEAGAEDVISNADGTFTVLTPKEEFGAVRNALDGAGIKMNEEKSGLQMMPMLFATDVSDEDYESCRDMEEKLLALEDVDAVYTQLEDEEAEE